MNTRSTIDVNTRIRGPRAGPYEMATPDGHVIVAPALLVPMLPSAKVREVRRPGEYYYTAVPGLGGYRTVPTVLYLGK